MNTGFAIIQELLPVTGFDLLRKAVSLWLSSARSILFCMSQCTMNFQHRMGGPYSELGQC